MKDSIIYLSGAKLALSIGIILIKEVEKRWRSHQLLLVINENIFVLDDPQIAATFHIKIRRVCVRDFIVSRLAVSSTNKIPFGNQVSVCFRI